MQGNRMGCPVWGDEFEAFGRIDPDSGVIEVDHSPRAGGGFTIMADAQQRVSSIESRQKAQLTTLLVSHRLYGTNKPLVDARAIDDSLETSPLTVHDRAQRLLRLLARNTPEIGGRTTVGPRMYDAFAWSESVEWTEVIFLLEYLKQQGWLLGPNGYGESTSMRVTVGGYQQVEQEMTEMVSSQGFVAMWFDASMAAVYEYGIRPALADLGYTAVRIDRTEHINKIDDEIIREIRRSRLVVADFTHGKSGARGGVYFEAGFAHGLGIPVFYTCRRDMVESLHFDTRQYAHILWDDPSELRQGLANRIGAVIGEARTVTLPIYT